MDRIYEICSAKGKATGKQTTSRLHDVWPDMWKFMSDAAKKKSKQRWAIEKPELDIARQLRRIFFIEPNDEEVKRKMKNCSSTKVKNKSEVIGEARNKGCIVHVASLMDICHLKNSELEPQFQKYKGRVVLPGDTVKDDSGSYAVLTEQGSSASQMTAAKVMDGRSRLPGCAGQAADAVSADTLVKMEDAPSLLKIPKSECPDIWIRLPRHNWPKSWFSMEDPVILLERNLYGHPLAELCWERQFEKILPEHEWENVPHGKASLRQFREFMSSRKQALEQYLPALRLLSI